MSKFTKEDLLENLGKIIILELVNEYPMSFKIMCVADDFFEGLTDDNQYKKFNISDIIKIQ